MSIHVGQKIYSDALPQVFGRVGIILSDPVGNLVIATSSDFLSHCGAVLIEEGEKFTPQGERPNRFKPDNIDDVSAMNLLGWFKPDDHSILEKESMSERAIISMQDAFMEEVEILGADHERSRGFVTKVNCFAYFDLPTSKQPQLIQGLIKAADIEGEKPFATAGCGGAMVVTSNGSLVGFVVGILDDGALIAPLFELCVQESFSIATNADIEEFNLAAVTIAVPEVSTDVIPATIINMHKTVIPVEESIVQVRKTVSQWLLQGWSSILSGNRKSAFMPYSNYFLEVDENPSTLEEAFINFAQAELNWDPVSTTKLNEEIADGFFDFLETINRSKVAVEKVPHKGIKGSHDRIIGVSNAA